MLVYLLLALVLTYLIYRLALIARAALARQEARALARQRAEADAARLEREALDALSIEDIEALVRTGWQPPAFVEHRREEHRAAEAVRARERRVGQIEADIKAGRKVSQSDLRLITDARLKSGRSVPSRNPYSLAEWQSQLERAGVPFETISVADQAEPIALRTGQIVTAGRGPGSLTITADGVHFNPGGYQPRATAADIAQYARTRRYSS